MTITTGLKSLDDLIGGGLQPGSLTLYAGTSQSGMTTLLDTTVTAAALTDGVPTLLADLESGDRQSRILSAHSGVKLVALQRGILTAEDAARAAGSAAATAGAPLQHTSSCDRLHLLAEAMEAEAKLIAIDGVRYVRCGPGGRDDLGEILISLRDLARGQNAAVVITAPINRDDVRPGSRPSLGSLPAEFGLNCDTVVLIERWGSLGGPESTPEPVELIVPKNRYGHIGQTSVLGDYTHARFLDREPQSEAKAA
jgi:replicative DNA helicase